MGIRRRIPLCEAISVIDDRKYADMMEKYAVLEVKMKDLYGNGKPGRVQKLERIVLIGTGVGLVVVPIVLELARVYIQHLWK